MGVTNFGSIGHFAMPSPETFEDATIAADLG